MEDRNDYLNESSDESNENENEASASTTKLFLGSPRQALARYSQCHQCKARLHFTHITDFSRNLTEETARCPECGTQDRKVVHRLQ